MFWFFAMPGMAVFWIYFLAAVIPAVVLMKYVYNQDSIEKEPPSLLWSLILMGVMAALCSIVLELIGENILNHYVSESDPEYYIVLAFLVVAVIEEGTKFFFLYRRTWHDINFNYRFDAIVFAVFVSLGFAAFENIKYVFGYGLSVSIPRAILAVPGHLGFAVFMGYFYGRAKLCEDTGNKGGKIRNLIFAYLSAVLLHGFYDSCAMIGDVKSTVLFVAFIVIMYIVVFRLIKHEAKNDRPV
jgi:RsiW-degrading membrane proteinase PrsW (M82 family)